jgi:hypothetical protein
VGDGEALGAGIIVGLAFGIVTVRLHCWQLIDFPASDECT